MSEYSPKDIIGERRAQYGPQGIRGESLDQRADDLRRILILKYSLHPDVYLSNPEAVPRNMWAEITQRILDEFKDGTENILGADIGTSSAYLPELLFAQGYKGGLLAADAEISHFPQLSARFSEKFPDANIWYGRADAEIMRSVQLMHGERLTVQKNTFDFATVLNIMHHTRYPDKVIKTTANIVKPGGLVVFMGRAVGHLHNLYDLGGAVGEKFVARAPRPFYEHYDMFTLTEALGASDDLEIVDTDEQIARQTQGDYIWVPDNEEGRRDYFGAFYALLPLMRSGITGRPLRPKHVEKYLLGEFKDEYFPTHGSYRNINGQNYFTDFVFQRYIVCRVIK